MELQLVNLTKEFGNFRAVNNLNLTISNGVYGLLGVNGAGKTTLMKMICSLLTPTSGKILCDGQDIGGLKTLKRGFSRSSSMTERMMGWRPTT